MATAVVVAALVALGVGALQNKGPFPEAGDAPHVAAGEPSPVSSEAPDLADPSDPTGTTVPDPAVTALAASGPPADDVGGGERLVVPGYLPVGFKPDGGQNSIDPNPPTSRIAIWRNPATRLGAPALMVVTAFDNPALAPWIVQHLQGDNTAAVPMSRATVAQPAGVAIYLFGLGLTSAELATAASVITAKTTNPSDGARVGSLGGGFTQVADYGPSAPIRGTSLSYAQGGNQDPQLTIQTGGPRQVGLELVPFTVPGPFQPTSIRGHDGFAVGDAVGPSRSFVWLESPGQVVAVSGYKLDVETVKRVIENLRTLPTAEWETQMGLPQEAATASTGH